MAAMRCARAALCMNMPSWRSRRPACVGIMLRCPDSAEPTLPPPLLNGPTTLLSLSTMPYLLVSSESDDSDCDEEGASPPASPPGTERAGTAALPVSAATSLPVVGALVAELPGIIARAAANLGLAVPMPQGPQRPDQLRGIWGLEAATRPARLDPIWPMFPAIRPYFSGAAAEPRRLGAPVKTFIQVTKTEVIAGAYRPDHNCFSRISHHI
ncbi:unnamed protein product [Boreogadus saida]